MSVGFLRPCGTKMLLVMVITPSGSSGISLIEENSGVMGKLLRQ